MSREYFGVQALDVEPVIGLRHCRCFRVSAAWVLQISHHLAVFRESHHMAAAEIPVG
jgi:hypothetical protein